jgi:hypothetical protein
MLGIGAGEDVLTVPTSHEVQEPTVRRIQCRLDTCFGGCPDWTGGKSVDQVGVVRGGCSIIALVEAPPPPECVDDRRVGLQSHSPIEAVVVHRRYVCSIGLVPNLSFDDAGQGYDLMTGHAQGVEPRRPCRVPVTLELGRELADDVSSVSVDTNEMGAGVQVALERGSRNTQPFP